MSVTESRREHLVISASAGSGKTFLLAHRYVELLAAGELPDRILATTFTRKAAAEIRQRVLSLLARAASDEGKCAALASRIKRTLTREDALRLLETMLRHLHRLQISTLDSFFAQLAGSFALELGLAPGWRIVDEDVEERLRHEAVRSLLAKGRRRDLAALLRLLARGQVRRSVHEQILGLARQLHDRFRDTPPGAWKSVRRPRAVPPERFEAAAKAVETFDLSGAPSLAKARGEDLERFHAADWDGFVATGIAGRLLRGHTEFRKQPIDPRLAALYEPLLDHAVALLLGRIVDQTDATHRLLEHFDRQYTRLKSEWKAMRFDDVTRALVDLRGRHGLIDIYFRLDARIGHLLLDEFQDTSLSQWRVLEPIAEEALSHADGSRSFFCVGDVKQAIYGWRGGLPQVFSDLRRRDEIEERPLHESFRSSPVIIDLVNDVFGELPRNPAVGDKHRQAVEAWHADFARHTTARKELAGYVRLAVAPAAGDDTEQAATTCEFAAREIARLRQEAPGRSIGVLVRKNETLSRMIFELRRLGIFASEEGGVRLTDSPAVLAVLSLMRLADHPGDEVSRFIVAESPLGRAVGLEGREADPARRVASSVRRRLATDGYGSTILRWSEQLAPACDSRSLERLLRLVDLAHRHDDEATLRPSDFVRRAEAAKVEDATASDVRVMTLHQAKGLEFDLVVLPELDCPLVGRQSPPILTWSHRPAAGVDRVTCYIKELLTVRRPELRCFLEEYYDRQVRDSLSLLYVGITRAKHALHLLIPPARNPEKFPEDFAGVLRGSLARDASCSAGSVPVERGNPRWHETAGEGGRDEGDAESSTPPAPELPPPELAPSRGRRRSLVRESPSALEGGELRLADRLRLDAPEGRRRGSLIHAWFEAIDWLDGGVPSEDELLRRAAAHLAPGERPEEFVEEFRGMLEHTAVREALSREAAVERLGVRPGQRRDLTVRVDRERRFALRQEDRILSGTFDRLVTLRDGERPVAAEIVDFKTDRVEPEDAAGIERLVEFYRPQLEAYRQAAARLTRLPGEKIRAQLLFVRAGVARFV